MPTIYLDVSCLNRAFDDQTQPRVRLEAQAIMVIFEMFEAGDFRHVSSVMAELELGAMSDPDRRARVELLLPDAASILPLTEPILTLRTAKRNGDKLQVRVENPLVWLKEIRP